jgi:hypothetical protein
LYIIVTGKLFTLLRTAPLIVRGKRKEERGKRKEERGKRKEERGKRKEERGKIIRGKRKEEGLISPSGCALRKP